MFVFTFFSFLCVESRISSHCAAQTHFSRSCNRLKSQSKFTFASSSVMVSICALARWLSWLECHPVTTGLQVQFWSSTWLWVWSHPGMAHGIPSWMVRFLGSHQPSAWAHTGGNSDASLLHGFFSLSLLLSLLLSLKTMEKCPLVRR